MSSHQNKGGLARLLVMIALGVVIYNMMSNRGNRGSSPSASPSPSSAVPAAQNGTPQASSVDAALQPKDVGEKKDGVGAMILVDVSGSMLEPVADAGGGKSPKIEIARRAVLKLVKQTADFAKAHPEQNVQLGIYEFSDRKNQPPCREVIALATPDPERAAAAVAAMRPDGGTPIGDAIIAVKHKLDAAGLKRMHILVVTDGENNKGYRPADVVAGIGRLPEISRASVYFVAFDVSANAFKPAREAGALVLPAANEAELQQTLDYVLTGKILVE